MPVTPTGSGISTCTGTLTSIRRSDPDTTRPLISPVTVEVTASQRIARQTGSDGASRTQMNLCADRNVRRGVDDTMWRGLRRVPGDSSPTSITGDEWQRIQAEIVEPQTESEFVAWVEFVDDRRYEKLDGGGTAPSSTGRFGRYGSISSTRFALTHPDRPILVVNRCDRVESPKTGVKGRCTVLHSASSWPRCISWGKPLLGNMDWEEFADKAGHDGIFLGFE